MPNVNTNFSYTIQAVDVAANVSVFQRALQNFQLSATAWQASDWCQVPVAGLSLNLASIAGTAYFFYARNLGANNVTVTYTPAGGASSSLVLLPVGSNSGGIFLYALSAETAGGLTAISFTAATATTPVEYFMAA